MDHLKPFTRCTIVETNLLKLSFGKIYTINRRQISKCGTYRPEARYSTFVIVNNVARFYLKRPCHKMTAHTGPFPAATVVLDPNTFRF